MNKNTHLCRLQFEIDAENQLVIKDIANRPVLIGITGNKGLTTAQQQQWQHLIDQAMVKITDSEHHIIKARTSFHGAMPHNFISGDFPALIEQSLNDCVDEVAALKLVAEKSAFRITHMNEYFSQQ